MIRDLIPDWSKQGYVGYQEAYFVSKYDLRNYVYIKVVFINDVSKGLIPGLHDKIKKE